MTEPHTEKFPRPDFPFLQATTSDIFYSVFFCCIKKKKWCSGSVKLCQPTVGKVALWTEAITWQHVLQ